MTASGSGALAETCAQVLQRLRGFVTQEEERVLAAEEPAVSFPQAEGHRSSDLPLSVELLAARYDGTGDYDDAFGELESLEVRLLVHFDAATARGLRDSAPSLLRADSLREEKRSSVDDKREDDEGHEEDEEEGTGDNEDDEEDEDEGRDDDDAEKGIDREDSEEAVTFGMHPPSINAGEESQRFRAWIDECRDDSTEALGATPALVASWVSRANDAQISRRLRSRALAVALVGVATPSADPHLDEAISRYRTIRAWLVETNVRLALAFALRHRGSLTASEAVGVAVTGLIRGIDGYESARGFRLATYAVHWIQQSLTRANMDYSSPIRTPVHLREKVQLAKAVTRAMDGTTTCSLSVAELAKLMESDAPIAEGSRAAARFVSFGDCTFGDIADLDTTVDSRRLIPSDGGRDAEVESRLIVLESRLHETLQAVAAPSGASKQKVARAAQLREILDARLAIGRRTRAVLQSIGTMYGVTRERIRQLEKIALKLANKALRRETGAGGDE